MVAALRHTVAEPVEATCMTMRLVGGATSSADRSQHLTPTVNRFGYEEGGMKEKKRGKMERERGKGGAEARWLRGRTIEKAQKGRERFDLLRRGYDSA
ncbi:MAG: hypothetical protein LBS86_07685 [Treponema sp.]|jgi:hypothetical protein|nr:hypothetical protein [Treponema sp.]